MDAANKVAGCFRDRTILITGSTAFLGRGSTCWRGRPTTRLPTSACSKKGRRVDIEAELELANEAKARLLMARSGADDASHQQLEKVAMKELGLKRYACTSKSCQSCARVVHYK
jgi:hypothetical protein